MRTSTKADGGGIFGKQMQWGGWEARYEEAKAVKEEQQRNRKEKATGKAGKEKTTINSERANGGIGYRRKQSRKERREKKQN